MVNEELLNQLEQLKEKYGETEFNNAIRKIKRKKLQIAKEQREKRIKFSWTTYKKLYNKQRGICPLCNESMPFIKGEIHIDHKNPNETNFNAEYNLQVVHKQCNLQKSSKSLIKQSKFYGKTITELLS